MEKIQVNNLEEEHSVNSDGTIVANGARAYDSNRGTTRIYEYSSGSWSQLGSDINGLSTSEYSGDAVSLNNDGTIVAIGAWLKNSQTGTTRIYEYSSGSWSQIGSDINGTTSGERSGYSVSLNGDGTIVAIGAYKYSSSKGHVRIYQYISGSWSLLGSQLDGVSSNDIGYSVSLNNAGTILAIGAWGYSSNTGRTYIYQYSSNAWNNIGEIAGGTSERFGNAVS